ncbi:hypothetical protein D3C87_1037470 [compost metagenome]
MATVRLTKEQREAAKKEKLENKLEAQMKKLAIKVKKKFPKYTVKYNPWGVELCLGWDWDEDKVLSKVGDRALKLFGHGTKSAGSFSVCADTSGYKVKTLQWFETLKG